VSVNETPSPPPIIISPSLNSLTSAFVKTSLAGSVINSSGFSSDVPESDLNRLNPIPKKYPARTA